MVTNGTPPGTHELTGIGGAASNLNPGSILAFNGELLFGGSDSSGNSGLWVSNGTAAGTSEISRKLDAGDLTAFNGEVLFEGTPLNGNTGLWVTNGSGAGTSELASISGANSGGLNPSYLTVFNNEVLFQGFDSTGNEALWVTNGTVAGTSEVGGPGSSGIIGAFRFGFVPSYMTVFNSEVLFYGVDTSGAAGLWVTNGLAAGTHELSISGANAGGIFGNTKGPAFTVFNGEVLFAGDDASGNNGLWVTNGTSGGTSALTGIAGAYTGAAGLDPVQLTLFNGEVLFRGRDTSGNYGLWETNGTAAGTSELGVGGTFTGTNGFQPNNFAAVKFVVPPPDNFNSNNTSDILFRNSSSGDTWLEVMSNGAATGWARSEAPTRPTAWPAPAISTGPARRTSCFATIRPATLGSRR